MKRLPSLGLAGGEIQSPMARDKGAAPTAIIRDTAGVLAQTQPYGCGVKY